MFENIKKFIVNKDEYYPNVQVFGYHFLKAIKKLSVKIGLLDKTKNGGDMFNWSLYHLHYKGELRQASKFHTQSLKQNDYIFKANKLVKNNQIIKPLHESHEFLYETILQLNPLSIFEMGCGTGMHLNNIKILIPGVRVCGVDLSEQQLSNLKRTYPLLVDDVKQMDVTVSVSDTPFKQCDLAYTQAVIMHIRTNDSHLVALENLFAMSKKYVILMEAIKNHDYLNDIKKLFSAGKIKWNRIYFYYRLNEKTGKPNGIICSNEPLKYPELKDLKIFYETNLKI